MIYQSNTSSVEKQIKIAQPDHPSPAYLLGWLHHKNCLDICMAVATTINSCSKCTKIIFFKKIPFISTSVMFSLTYVIFTWEVFQMQAQNVSLKH